MNVGTVTSSSWVELSGGGIYTGVITANLIHSFDFYDGTTNIIDIDTRNTVTAVTAVKVTASPPTIATATGDTFSQFGVAAVTVTLTGTNTVTALDGVGAYLGIPTVTNTSAGTITTVSNLYVAAPAAAGGSAVITNSYAIHSAGGVLVDAGGVTVTAGGVKIVASGINLAAAAQTITVKANTQHATDVYDGTTNIIDVDTRNTVSMVAVTVTASPPTITAAAGVTFSQLKTAPVTVTLTGTGTVTAINGAALYLGAPTFTDSMPAPSRLARRCTFPKSPLRAVPSPSRRPT